MKKISMDELGRVQKEEYHSLKKMAVVIVLDNIRSMNNIGSVFRTADAFLVEAVYLCGFTAKPPHREIEKTALGATESVQWKYYKSTADAVEEMKNNGAEILAVEQTNHPVFLQDFKVEEDKKYVLIFGNEVSGVDDEVLKLCHASIEIPQQGTKHSLNIAVAAGIVLWHFYEKLSLSLK